MGERVFRLIAPQNFHEMFSGFFSHTHINTFAKIELEKSTLGSDFINLVNATEHRCDN